MSLTAAATLSVKTTTLPESPNLLGSLDPFAPLAWIRGGDGFAGIGEALRLEFSGPSRFVDACETWRSIADLAQVDDSIKVPGSGLVAFGTFAFSDSSAATSVLIVPRILIGRRNGRSWLTTVAVEGDHPRRSVPAVRKSGDEYRIVLTKGRVNEASYEASVAAAVARIRNGDLGKVVLARDINGHLPPFSDQRLILSTLANGYPDCWTFAVDGFVGASPETLVTVSNGTVTARVLAGSTGRGTDAQTDKAAAADLFASPKDRKEHEFAVRDVLTALAKHTSELSTTENPFTLKLPNVWHLASDIEGKLSDGSTSLNLIAALHPTAAVAGTPTSVALELIEQLEPFDRGRYAGPVGWVGADGDGEWAIGLRSAQIDPNGDVTAFAGAGIVADSDPAHEFAETRMKFRPIIDAFG